MTKVKWGLILVAISLASGAIGFIFTSSILNRPEDKKVGKDLEVIEEIAKPLAPCIDCVYITKSLATSYKTNPILNVSVYKNSNLLNTYQTVSGRWNTQNLDRNIANNSSPSPNGTYIIKDETIGYHPETGGVFLPYEPTFNTERSALGFHVDPSWGLEVEDGTRGCNAFETMLHYNSFKKDIKTNNITTLIINYE